MASCSSATTCSPCSRRARATPRRARARPCWSAARPASARPACSSASRRRAGRGRVLWGGCESLATPRPLGPLHDVAAQRRRARCARCSRGRTTAAALFGAVLDELARAPAPTLLVFEDVHWADEATLDLIKFLGRRIQRLPALLRPQPPRRRRIARRPASGLRRAAGGAPDAPRVPPSHARRPSTARRRRSARVDGAGVFAVTGGNPFFVTEVLRHGDAPERRAVDASATPCSAARAPARRAAARRCCSWPPSCRARSSCALVADVLAPPTEDVEACLASGLLVADGAAAALSPRAGAHRGRGSDPAAARAALHARVLAALATRPRGTSTLARLAHHARRAGDVDAVAALGAAGGARGRVARRAPRGGRALPRRARPRRSASTTRARAALLDAYATHSFELNDLAAAIPAREEAIALFARTRRSRAAQSEALAAHALALVRALRNADADAASQRAIALAEALAPGRALARAYADPVLPAHAQPRLRGGARLGREGDRAGRALRRRAHARPPPSTRSAPR